MKISGMAVTRTPNVLLEKLVVLRLPLSIFLNIKSWQFWPEKKTTLLNDYFFLHLIYAAKNNNNRSIWFLVECLPIASANAGWLADNREFTEFSYGITDRMIISRKGNVKIILVTPSYPPIVCRSSIRHVECLKILREQWWGALRCSKLVVGIRHYVLSPDCGKTVIRIFVMLPTDPSIICHPIIREFCQFNAHVYSWT